MRHAEIERRLFLQRCLRRAAAQRQKGENRECHAHDEYFPKEGPVVACQPWLKGERADKFRRRHSGARPLWREPGIHNHQPWLWIPGLRQEAHPGMTATNYAAKIR